MRAPWLLALALLTGCNGLLGIEDVRGEATLGIEWAVRNPEGVTSCTKVNAMYVHLEVRLTDEPDADPLAQELPLCDDGYFEFYLLPGTYDVFATIEDEDHVALDPVASQLAIPLAEDDWQSFTLTFQF